MRTATAETRRALKAAIGDGSQRAWARENGIPHGTVSDCLLGKSMLAHRENVLRAALGLPLIRRQMVELLEGQRIVTVSQPRMNKRRAATMPPELAAFADAKARAKGYRSWGAMEVYELQQEFSADAIYSTRTGRNGYNVCNETEEPIP